MALAVFLLRQLGAEVLMLTNAAGGLHADLDAGDLMIITDHLNLMGDHPLIGPHEPAWGPRFPDMSQVYCPKLGQRLGLIFEALHLPVRRGVYAAVTGPTYETPAEVRLLRSRRRSSRAPPGCAWRVFPALRTARRACTRAS